jgi:hypothetical protein
MLETSEAEWANSRRALRRALDDLRITSGALRSSEERFRVLVMATSDMLYRMSPDWAEMLAFDGRGVPVGYHHAGFKLVAAVYP